MQRALGSEKKDRHQDRDGEKAEEPEFPREGQWTLGGEDHRFVDVVAEEEGPLKLVLCGGEGGRVGFAGRHREIQDVVE